MSNRLGYKAGGSLDVSDERLDNLHCFGCAHSAASASYPGHPSGERPCCFCIRNPDREAWQKGGGPVVDKWYDGSAPFQTPMDCYQTMDMQEQWRKWAPTFQRDIASVVKSFFYIIIGQDGGEYYLELVSKDDESKTTRVWFEWNSKGHPPTPEEAVSQAAKAGKLWETMAK